MAVRLNQRRSYEEFLLGVKLIIHYRATTVMITIDKLYTDKFFDTHYYYAGPIRERLLNNHVIKVTQELVSFTALPLLSFSPATNHPLKIS